MSRIHRSLCALLLPALMLLALPRAQAAEIPGAADGQALSAGEALQAAGLPAAEAAARAQSLDQAETAELSRSDLEQQGGDALITVAVIAAIVAIVYIYFQHTENMAR